MVVVLAITLAAVAANKRLDLVQVVGESVENFRAEPNGAKLGTLMKGTEIEQIGAEGKWVRFRVEGWIWGPSLDGYVNEEERGDTSSSTEPISPLLGAMPRLKKLVNDKYGVFYGADLDEDFQRLRLRMRVRDLEDEALPLRLQTIQRGVHELLEGVVEFQVLRIETNRPDGSGEVGIYVAEMAVDDLVRYPADEKDWRTHMRFSKDGGETWEGGE